MAADLTGRVAVVTGAAGGIGSAITQTLAAAGARVAAVDLPGPRLAKLAELAIAPYPADLRRTDEVERVVDRVEREVGPIDILVNAAGILRAGPVGELSDTDWSDVFDVNVHGVVRCCRAVAGRMRGRGHGSIVTIGSNAGGVARMNMSAYAAAKAATVHFMRCLGLELAADGVRCNVVSPGSTDTDMQRALWGDDDAGMLDRVVAGSPELYRLGIPLRRIAAPRDIADAVLFLAGDTARHITMQDLYVDGGATLGQH